MTKLKTNQKRKIRRRKANTTARQRWCKGLSMGASCQRYVRAVVSKEMRKAFREFRFKCSIPKQSGRKNCYSWDEDTWCLWILKTGKFNY